MKSIVACAVIACGGDTSEQPPPVLRSLSEIYESFGLSIAPEYATYNVEQTDDSVQTRNLGEFEATFYTAFCPTGCTGITATGIDVRNTIYHEGKRVIAVDPNVIPIGSPVRVTLANGDSFEAVAGDTGGAIKGRRIDVLVATRDEAYRLGRMSAKVEIIE